MAFAVINTTNIGISTSTFFYPLAKIHSKLSKISIHIGRGLFLHFNKYTSRCISAGCKNAMYPSKSME